MSEKLLYWVWLTTLLNFSSVRFSRIYSKFTPEEAYNASREELCGAGLSEDEIESLENRDLTRAREIICSCEKQGISIIPANSRYYPRALERLHDRPYVIYAKGDLSVLKKKTAAFVGTRRMTKKGEAIAVKTAGELLDEGYLLISGLADGIDLVGARVSLERGLPFVTVQGVDIDKRYPASNEAIAEKGLIISEYPPDTNARYFVRRNRILAGLSDEIYVTEAPETSGALSTAEYGRRIGVRIHATHAEGLSFAGCVRLIDRGAIPIGDAPLKREKEKKMPSLDGTRLYIYERLKRESASEEELIDEKHPITEVLTALTELELDGIITALPGGKYKLN